MVFTGRCKRKSGNISTTQRAAVCKYFQFNNGKKGIPLSLKETKNRKDELYNDVVTVTHSMKLKFSKSEENILKIIKNVCNALWMIDGNHEKFNTSFAQGHCSKLPQLFSDIYNKSYNDWKSQKKTKLKLSADALLTCSNNLYDALSIWNVGGSSQKFASGCRALTGCLRSYSDYLFKATERMSLARASPQQEINFTLPNPMEATNQISENYRAIDNVVRDLPLYEPVFLDNDVGDFNMPHDRTQRDN